MRTVLLIRPWKLSSLALVVAVVLDGAALHADSLNRNATGVRQVDAGMSRAVVWVKKLVGQG
jgi:hypothetical protein